MLNAVFEISKINYENTFAALFPALLKKGQSIQSGNLLIRLFQKMDSDAMPLMMGFMRQLADAEKDELLAVCVNAYSRELTEAVNSFLKSDKLGRNFVLGRLSVGRQESALFLEFEQVQVDYAGLMADREVQEKVSGVLNNKLGLFGKFAQKGVNLAAEYAPGKTERVAVELLNKEGTRQLVLQMAQKALKEKGLDVTLQSITLNSGDRAAADGNVADIVDAGLHLSAELEEAILEGLARYLRTLGHDA